MKHPAIVADGARGAVATPQKQAAHALLRQSAHGGLDAVHRPRASAAPRQLSGARQGVYQLPHALLFLCVFRGLGTGKRSGHDFPVWHVGIRGKDSDNQSLECIRELASYQRDTLIRATQHKTFQWVRLK
jgi:hypothetical protein